MIARIGIAAENAVVVTALAVMMMVPLLESIGRSLLGVGIPGAAPIVQHLTLWIAFLGAALAAREGKLLALATGELIPAGWGKNTASVIAGAVGCGVSMLLLRGSVDLVMIERTLKCQAKTIKIKRFGEIIMRPLLNDLNRIIHRRIGGHNYHR